MLQRRPHGPARFSRFAGTTVAPKRAKGSPPPSKAILTFPMFILGRKKLPRRLPDLIGFGDESEAVCYAVENIDAWKGTAGVSVLAC